VAAGKFLRASSRLLRFLGEEDAALAGGMAVNAHGFIRATRDVDIIVSIPLEEARKRLEGHGVGARLFRGDPIEGGFSCLKGVIGRGSAAVPFDVLPQLVPLDPGRMVELTVAGYALRVVDLETLIRLKLKAGSVKDLHDVAILVLLRRGWRERASALAAHDLDVSTRLAQQMDDPRVQAEAREIRRQDRLLHQAPKGSRRPAGGRKPTRG
jgi:hypothetical protein